MTTIGDGFKSIFLAGIGALAYTGEKGKEIVDALVEKGEMTVDQGMQINQELQRKAAETGKSVREGALEATMKAMSPEDRLAFAAKAAELADAQNAADEAAAAVEAEMEAVAEESASAFAQVAEAIGGAIEETAGTLAETVAAAVGTAQEVAKEAAAKAAETAEVAAAAVADFAGEAAEKAKEAMEAVVKADATAESAIKPIEIPVEEGEFGDFLADTFGTIGAQGTTFASRIDASASSSAEKESK